MKRGRVLHLPPTQNNMQPNSNKKWIIILAVALVIVTGLWLRELSKPAGIEQFKADLVKLQGEVDVACADTTTEEGNKACTGALEDLQAFLDQLK